MRSPWYNKLFLGNNGFSQDLEYGNRFQLRYYFKKFDNRLSKYCSNIQTSFQLFLNPVNFPEPKTMPSSMSTTTDAIFSRMLNNYAANIQALLALNFPIKCFSYVATKYFCQWKLTFLSYKSQ